MDHLKKHIGRVPNFPKDGIIFRDIAPALANADVHDEIIDAFVQEWRDKVNAILALDARGFIFASY